MQRITQRTTAVLTALLLTLAIAIATILLLLPSPAAALSDTPPDPDPTPEPVYDTIVYVTNHNQHDFLSSRATRVYRYDNSKDFYCLSIQNDYNEIYDSFVIIDVRLSGGSVLSSWFSIMDTICYDLQNAGCLVMYINNHDEGRFENSSNALSFLDYVDIHVNTDLDDLFMDNAFREVTEFQNASPDYDVGYELHNCIFVLDNYYSSNEVFPYFFNYFLYYSLGLNIWIDFSDITSQENTLAVYNALVNRGGIYFVVPDEAPMLYPSITYTYDTINQNISNQIDPMPIPDIENYTVIPIANTESGISALDEWADVADKLASYTQGYNTYDGREDTFEFTYFMFCGRYGDNNTYYGSTHAMYDHYFHLYAHYYAEVENDCLYGNDLTKYINWIGRCNVTHITLDSGENGWIKSYYFPIRQIIL